MTNCLSGGSIEDLSPGSAAKAEAGQKASRIATASVERNIIHLPGARPNSRFKHAPGRRVIQLDAAGQSSVPTVITIHKFGQRQASWRLPRKFAVIYRGVGV